MNIRQLRNKTYDYPHRCNDEDLSAALDYIEKLQEDYAELDSKYAELCVESRQHSFKLIGNTLSLLLNKPELLYKEKDEKVSVAKV